MVSQQSMSLTFGHHVEDKQPTNKNMVQGSKEKVKFPCMLCMRDHFTFHFPQKDEASQLLESCFIAQQYLPIPSQELPLKQTLVEQVVEPNLSFAKPTLPIDSDSKTNQVFSIHLSLSKKKWHSIQHHGTSFKS